MTNLNHRVSDFEYDIPSGFKDTSYGNDVCASITNDDLNLQVFIDAKNPEMREESSYPRFSVIYADTYGECGNTLFESEDFLSVLAFVNSKILV